MPAFTIYDKQTGDILQYGHAPQGNLPTEDDKVGVLIGQALRDQSHRIDPVTKEPVLEEKPPPPPPTPLPPLGPQVDVADALPSKTPADTEAKFGAIIAILRGLVGRVP